MKEYEKQPTGLLFQTEELRRMVAENPGDEFTSMYCSSVRVVKGEFLDCMQAVNEEISYFDRDQFEEELEQWLADGAPEDMSEEDFQELLKQELAEYAPYWKPCIILTVDN